MARAKLPFPVHERLRFGIPMESGVPWHTVRFARPPSAEERAAIATAFERAVFASSALARDAEGDSPWRWSEAMAIVVMPPADAALDGEEPAEYRRYVQQTEQVLRAIHGAHPIAEAWISEEPSGGEPDPAFERARADARGALVNAPAPAPRKARASAKAAAPAGWTSAPDVPPTARLAVPPGIAARFREVYAAERRGEAWTVLGYTGIRGTVAYFSSADAAPVESQVFHPSGLAESLALSADGMRALFTHRASGLYEFEPATGATTLLYRTRAAMADHVDGAYGPGDTLLVLTTAGLELVERSSQKVLARVRAGHGERVVATASGRRALLKLAKGTARARLFAVEPDSLRELATATWVGEPYAHEERLLSHARGSVWELTEGRAP